MIRKLHWWSEERFGIKLKDLGDALLHGMQDNWTDCGIIAVNTAIHEILNSQPLWTSQRKQVERVCWFLTLLHRHVLDVSERLNFVRKKTDNEKQINSNVRRMPYPQVLVNLLPASSITQNCPPIGTVVVAADSEGVTRAEGGVGKKRPVEHIEPNTDGKNAKLARRQADNANIILTRSEVDHGERYLAFQAKVLALDKYAEIVNVKTVRHLKCGKELAMRHSYDTQNFKSHVRNCKGPPKTAKLPGGGMRSITNWFQPTTNQRAAKFSPSQLNPTFAQCNEPCPGLDENQYKQIAHYLDRTGAYGGGASSVNKLAQELYGKKFRLLGKKRKLQVKTAQMHEWHWKNDHSAGKVFAMACLKTISVRADTALDDAILPCEACRSLLSLKKFKNACAVEKKPCENYKYLNKEYTGATRLVTLYAKSKQLVEIMDTIEVSMNDHFLRSFLSCFRVLALALS